MQVDLTDNAPVRGAPWPEDAKQVSENLTHLSCSEATALARQIQASQPASSGPLLLLHNELEHHEPDCEFATATPEEIDTLLNSLIAS